MWFLVDGYLRLAGSIVASRRGIACVVLLGLWCICLTPTHAQTVPKPPKACQEAMEEIISQGVVSEQFAKLRNTDAILCFWELALPQISLSASLRAEAEAQKTAATIQTGAPTGTNGTTSAVSKPFTPLSLATEYGGITSSTNNQTMTFQTTLDGIPAALATNGLVGYCWSAIVTLPSCVSASRLQWLNRFGFGVTANTTTASQSVTGTASPSSTTAQQASLANAGNKSPSLASVFGKFIIKRGKYEPGKQTLKQNGKAVDDAQEKINLAVRALEANGADFDGWSNCVKLQFAPERLTTTEARNQQFFKYWAQIVEVSFGSGQVSCLDNVSVTTQDQINKNRPTMAKRETWKKQITGPPALDKTSAEYKIKQGWLDLIAAVDDYLAAVQVFEAQADKMVLASPSALSVEYDYNTPVNQPTTSTVKLLYSYTGSKSQCQDKSNHDAASKKEGSRNKKAVPILDRLTTTVNVGGNFYNSAPSTVPGAGAFRDAQVGSEVDYAVCPSTKQPILSFFANGTVALTYYYQDQVSPSILKVASAGMPLPGINITGLSSSATQVFTKKGPINFVQLKYGFGVGKNVKFPIAVSWSNRSDLITHPTWSAQFGVSYDFSSLLNSSSAGSTK
jgi:hypothetical protein